MAATRSSSASSVSRDRSAGVACAVEGACAADTADPADAGGGALAGAQENAAHAKPMIDAATRARMTDFVVNANPLAV